MLFENNGHPSTKRNLNCCLLPIILSFDVTHILLQVNNGQQCLLILSYFFNSCTTNSTNTDNHRPKTMFPDMPVYPGAAFIATALGVHGYRKGSLSQSGAIAAFFVGYGHLANPVKLFGVTMIGMYLIGSRATKVSHPIPMLVLNR